MQISMIYKLITMGGAGFVMTACSSHAYMNAGHNHGNSHAQSSAYNVGGAHPSVSRYGTVSATSNCAIAIQCRHVALVPIAPVYPAQAITNNYTYPAPAIVYTQPEPVPHTPEYEEPPVYVPPPIEPTQPYSYPTPVAPEPITWQPAKK